MPTGGVFDELKNNAIAYLSPGMDNKLGRGEAEHICRSDVAWGSSQPAGLHPPARQDRGRAPHRVVHRAPWQAWCCTWPPLKATLPAHPQTPTCTHTSDALAPPSLTPAAHHLFAPHQTRPLFLALKHCTI